MNTREEILAYGLSFPDTYQMRHFGILIGSWCVFETQRKHFCGLMKRMVYCISM